MIKWLVNAGKKINNQSQDDREYYKNAQPQDERDAGFDLTKIKCRKQIKQKYCNYRDLVGESEKSKHIHPETYHKRNE